MHEEHSASTALSSAGQDNDRLAYSVAEAARRLDVSRMTLDRAGEVVAYDCWSARHRSASASMIRPRAAAACKRSVWARPAWPRRAARTLGPRPGATPSPGGAPQPRGRWPRAAAPWAGGAGRRGAGPHRLTHELSGPAGTPRTWAAVASHSSAAGASRPSRSTRIATACSISDRCSKASRTWSASRPVACAVTAAPSRLATSPA
jgi:hypothetical protein